MTYTFNHPWGGKTTKKLQQITIRGKITHDVFWMMIFTGTIAFS